MDSFSRDIWCINGLTFDCVDMATAIAYIKLAMVDELNRDPYFLSTPNLNFLIAAQTDSAFRESVINSDLSVADGVPIIWMARLLKIPLPERVTGSGLIEALFLEKNSRAVRVYFFGGKSGVGERACQAINQTDAGLHAVGYYCPGFGSVEEMSTNEIIEKINQSNIDFLIVALGAKKGQAWIEKNRSLLKVQVVSHLGAVINFFAGTVKRAPVLIQHLGLEWLWRITQEPSLWKRYFYDGWQLVKLLAVNIFPYAIWIRLNQSQLNDNHPLRLSTEEAKDVISLKLNGVCSVKTISSLRPVFRELTLKRKNIMIDLEAVPLVDGAFLGLCLLLYKNLKQYDCQLWIENAGEQNKKIIRWNRVGYLLSIR